MKQTFKAKDFDELCEKFIKEDLNSEREPEEVWNEYIETTKRPAKANFEAAKTAIELMYDLREIDPRILEEVQRLKTEKII